MLLESTSQSVTIVLVRTESLLPRPTTGTRPFFFKGIDASVDSDT